MSTEHQEESGDNTASVSEILQLEENEKIDIQALHIENICDLDNDNNITLETAICKETPEEHDLLNNKIVSPSEPPSKKSKKQNVKNFALLIGLVFPLTIKKSMLQNYITYYVKLVCFDLVNCDLQLDAIFEQEILPFKIF